MSDDEKPESDWGMTMSNSPNVGPLECLRIAYRRLRGKNDEPDATKPTRKSETVSGEVVKTVEKPAVEMDNYVEFWAKAGETYKVVKVDE